MTDRSPHAADHIIDAAEALQSPAPEVIEQRRQKRVPYDSLVALVLSLPNGQRSRPMVLRARDVSGDGIQVVSSHEIPVGAEGVMQLVRSDGQFALVGIRALHCRYEGHMEHRSGILFIPMPQGFTREDFVDAHGRMVLLDPLLRQNCEEKA